MKIFLIGVLSLGIITSCPMLFALDRNQISDYQQRLRNGDAAVRLSAMDEMGLLAERFPEKAGNDVVPFFTKGLNDPDSKVRNNAASNIAVIAAQTVPRFAPLKPGMIDLRSYSPLRLALEKLFSDPDVEIRRNAFLAYVSIYDFTPELQAKFVTLYGVERDGGIQEGIVEALALSDPPTKQTVQFLLHLLDDHNYTRRIAMSWSQLKGTPPQTALPKLVELLIKTNDSSERQQLASTVGKYGSLAHSYLSEIDKLRDKETDTTTKAVLTEAAETIRTGKSPEQK